MAGKKKPCKCVVNSNGMIVRYCNPCKERDPSGICHLMSLHGFVRRDLVEDVNNVKSAKNLRSDDPIHRAKQTEGATEAYV